MPPEYRLFFDAPILAAYRYGSRPFNLRLALSPLAQGDSVSQIVDRASFQTRISKEGQALTDARYFIKNRGNPNFRLTIPPGPRCGRPPSTARRSVPVFRRDDQSGAAAAKRGPERRAGTGLEAGLAIERARKT